MKIINRVSISRVENAATDKKGNFMIMSRTGIFFYDPFQKPVKEKRQAAPIFHSSINTKSLISYRTAGAITGSQPIKKD